MKLKEAIRAYVFAIFNSCKKVESVFEEFFVVSIVWRVHFMQTSFLQRVILKSIRTKMCCIRGIEKLKIANNPIIGSKSEMPSIMR